MSATSSLSLTLPPHIVPADPALVAVSGGRDSVALLHLLHLAGFTSLIVCHLNHGLRGAESDGDAAFVQRMAKKLNFKCEVEFAEVSTLAKERRLSVETAARAARHEFFLRMAEKHDVWMVFLAHHQEDQAETILGNLCRGSGLGGAAGMRSLQRMDNGLHLVRPMLQVRRSEIDAFLKSRRLRYREDSSNLSPEHRRNRLRQEAIPLLNTVFGRDVTPILARFGAQADRDDDCLSHQAMNVLTAPGQLFGDQSLAITPALRHLHPAVLSRVIALWLSEIQGIAGIDHDLLEDAMDMLSPDGPAKINLAGGKHLRRRARKLWVE